MLEELKRNSKQESLYTQEYFFYINSIASKLIFAQENQGKRIALEVKSDNEAISKAIEFEKDSIRYYDAMKEAISEGERNVLKEIIHEEELHLEKLVSLRTNFDKG